MPTRGLEMEYKCKNSSDGTWKVLKERWDAGEVEIPAAAPVEQGFMFDDLW